MTDEYKTLVGTIVAHRAVGVITLEQANMMFRNLFKAEKEGLPAPRFAELAEAVK